MQLHLKIKYNSFELHIYNPSTTYRTHCIIVKYNNVYIQKILHQYFFWKIYCRMVRLHFHNLLLSPGSFPLYGLLFSGYCISIAKIFYITQHTHWRSCLSNRKTCFDLNRITKPFYSMYTNFSITKLVLNTFFSICFLWLH